MINTKKYLWDGSYTIEAAFLVPIILGILYAWMFQLFYLRDEVVMNGMLAEMIVQMQINRDGEGEYDEEAKRQALQSCLWIARIMSLQQKNNTLETKYKLEAKATWNIPVMEMFLGAHFTSSQTQYIENIHPEKLHRLAGKDGN
jgi:hypothetical protein